MVVNVNGDPGYLSTAAKTKSGANGESVALNPKLYRNEVFFRSVINTGQYRSDYEKYWMLSTADPTYPYPVLKNRPQPAIPGTALIPYYNVTLDTVSNGFTGHMTWTPDDPLGVMDGRNVTIQIHPDIGSKFSKLVDNNTDVTSQVRANQTYRIQDIQSNHRLTVTFAEAPTYPLMVINGTAETSSGKFYAGANITVTANTIPRKVFSHWTAEGITLSAENLSAKNFTFVMPNQTVNLTATYTDAPKFSVQVTNGTLVGGVTSGMFYAGDQIIAIANLSKGDFFRWNVTGLKILPEEEKRPVYLFTMPENNVTVEAIYKGELSKHTVTVVNATISGHTGEVASHYPYEMITVTAKSIPGKTFSGWNVTGLTLDTDQRMQSTFSFRMPQTDVVLEATYTDTPKFTVTITNGTFADGSTSGLFSAGDTITVTADVPVFGTLFSRWIVTGLISDTFDLTQSPFTFTMPAQNVTLAAAYVESPKFSVQVTNGTLADGSTSGLFYAGENITVTANTPPGTVFLRWFGHGLQVDLASQAQSPFTFTMPAHNVTLEAQYVPKMTYTVVVLDGIISDTNGSTFGNYYPGETVTVTANPPDSINKIFSHWTVQGLTLRPNVLEYSTLTFTMPAKRVVLSAVYKEAPKFSVQITNGTLVGGVTSGMFYAGEEITVTADAPSVGTAFSCWNATGVVLETSQCMQSPITFTMPEQNVTLAATYRGAAQFSIMVINGTLEDDSVSGAFYAGETVTVTAAAPAVGKTFTGWNVTGVVLDSSQRTHSPLTFTMPANDVTLEATYAADDQYAVAVLSGGTISMPDGNVNHGMFYAGEEVTLIADPPSVGKKFSQWKVLSNPSSFKLSSAVLANSSLTFTMPRGSVVISATYVEVPKFSVQVINGTLVDGGTSGMFYAGENITVTANTTVGKSFFEWIVTGLTLGTEERNLSQIIFTMPENDVTLDATYIDSMVVDPSTPTETASPTPTETASPTPTETESPTPTVTVSPTPTSTSNVLPIATGAATPSATRTQHEQCFPCPL
ncbi:MAG: hypothetical protein O0W93_00350 [Methanocorpusculum sp.]|nr:hypothetical protein [Methanocorpusculum sp.]